MANQEDYTDETIMDFGMHKGAKLANVPASYFLYLYNNNKCFGKLKQYILENLEVLQKEIAKL